ncbi:MAG: dockerin type I domain-containing protein [Wujia sp.]
MNKKRNIGLLLIFVIILALLNPIKYDNIAVAATTGTISASSGVNFRSGPSTSDPNITDSSSKKIVLPYGHKVTIIETSCGSDKNWTKVTTVYNGVEYTGYVYSTYINVDSASIPSDVTFEESLTLQGFPESYKEQLRVLHAAHPNWQFVAIQTNIEWSTLLYNEIPRQGATPKNLVQGTSTYPNYNWRSTTVGYNWATDTWTPYDSTTWFAASDALTTYYLDPRTYLSEPYIFVFENLSYQEGVYTIEGIEAILKGTFMDGVAIGDAAGRRYSELIMIAAQASGVSPYHLASRMRQEMGTTATEASTGSYNGCYNLFNIGASDTPGGNPMRKGLDYAAGSGSYGRPWNTPEKAITGGAQYLGTSYINVGQDTLYTQKFNVTNKANLFNHQYMTNVQAPATECQAIYSAYKNNGLLNNTIVFKIPVYNSMPGTASVKPANSGNPNNWLKTLSVDGYTFTPAFACNTTNDYSLTVAETVTTINLNATTVNKYATVTGAGTINLSPGTNRITVSVKAQNGSIRNYNLTIIRGTPSETVGTYGKKGDLNGDGVISTIDIVKVQRLIVGLDATTSDSIACADINGDGKISTIDIVMLQRHIVGIETIQW